MFSARFMVAETNFVNMNLHTTLVYMKTMNTWLNSKGALAILYYAATFKTQEIQCHMHIQLRLSNAYLIWNVDWCYTAFQIWKSL